MIEYTLVPLLLIYHPYLYSYYRRAMTTSRTRSTHTYVLLEVSSAVYKEVYAKLKAANYDHVFVHNSDNPDYPHIDLTGIALTVTLELNEQQHP